VKWTGTPEEVARRILDEAKSRGDIKQAGTRVDQDPALRAALLQLAAARNTVLPDEPLSGKALVRAALDRQSAAQTLRNPIRRDEAFVCVHCGREVPSHGRTARNHCPHCLRSLHVDVIPGDRASDCGGILDPVGFSLRSGTEVIHYRCRRCGQEGVNRALNDGETPDDRGLLRRLSAREAI